jgi:ribosomal protein S18 acetylase RimI-like enzyme
MHNVYIQLVEQTTPGLLDYIVAWNESVLPGTMLNVPTLEHHLGNGSGRLYLALTGPGGTPVGYAVVSWKEEIFDILYLGIMPFLRGRGYGKAVIGELIDEAEKLGAQSVQLEVEKSNETAVKLYKGAGFRLEALTPMSYVLCRP